MHKGFPSVGILHLQDSTINNVHLESLIGGIKEQFDPILSQVQYEVMAEWCLEQKQTNELTEKPP